MTAWLDRAEATIRRALGWASGSQLRGMLAVALLALLTTLPGIAALPVTDRDEARFAQASKQMLETGDLVDIRFQDAPRWKKPAGIYWMQAASASVFGGADAPIWAYRLPSMLGVVLASALAVWALWPLAGGRGAVLSGAMLATTLLALAEANIAKTDAMLLASAVAVLGGVVRLMPGVPAPGWGTWALVWGAVGLAGLLKGPIVPVVAALALAALWIARRRPPPLARLRPVAGLALAILIVAPWLVAIWHISNGGFFEESVGRDLMGKVAEGQEKHWGPPGLYLLLVWATMWPWAALLPQAAPWLWARRREAAVTWLACWVVPFWLVLEAVPTKLPHYVLPLYPALLAALALWMLAGDRPEPPRGLRRASAWLVAVPGFGLALALVALPAALEGRVVPLAILAAVVGAAAVWLAVRAAMAARPMAYAGAGIVASAALAGGVLQAGLPALDTVFPSPRIAAAARPWMDCASGPLVSAGYREPSLVFHAGTGTRLPSPPATARILETRPGTLALVERRWWRLIDPHFRDGRPALETRATLTYFNYNRGDMEIADLVTTAGDWGDCEAAAR